MSIESYIMFGVRGSPPFMDRASAALWDLLGSHLTGGACSSHNAPLRHRVHGRAKGARMRRIPELDGLRGLAALTVVVFDLYPTVMPFGWAAVDLFFTLSGFLITGIILEQGDEPRFLCTFYVRRSLRIWPIYYVTIAALLLAGNVSWHRWLPFALYLQNTDFYLMPLEGMREKVFTPDWAMLNHAWSLAVEEQFYLIWPGLVLLAGRRRVRALTFGCLVGSVTARWAGYPSSILIT